MVFPNFGILHDFGGKFSTSFPGSLFFPGKKDTPRTTLESVFLLKYIDVPTIPHGQPWSIIPPPLSTAFFHIRVVSQGKAWKERKESRVNKKQLGFS